MSFGTNRSQTRAPIQTLDEARDAVQAIHVGKSYILTGSVDGHVRTYDLRMGELRTDFLGCAYSRSSSTTVPETNLEQIL